MSSERRSTLTINFVLGVLLAITFVPFILMIFLSFKSDAEVLTSFWALPGELRWEHYTTAGGIVSKYIWNSIKVAGIAIAGVLLVSSMAGYAFARHKFPGKEFLFYAILALMMIPGVLVLIPQYLLVKSLGLLDSHWGLILPYIAGGQVFGILLCRVFMSGIPQDIFDAARIDGANEFKVYWFVVLPLSLPILATIAIMQAFGNYNDFIWPLLVISNDELQVFTVALLSIAGQYNMRIGPVLAGYTIGCIPLLLVISFGMKYFIQGVTSGALKA